MYIYNNIYAHTQTHTQIQKTDTTYNMLIKINKFNVNDVLMLFIVSSFKTKNK